MVFFRGLIKLMVDERQEIDSKTQAKANSKGLLRAFLILVSVIGLLLLAKYVVPQALVYLTRATRSAEISLANSYVFGSPMRVAADGQSKIRVNVFLLSDQGLGVPDRQVSLAVQPKTAGVGGNAQIKTIRAITDKFGQAVFEVVSSFAGQFLVTASVEGIELPQKITLTFY